MVWSLQAVLGGVEWYARARQGFCMLCAAALLSIALILALPDGDASYGGRISIACAPALAFALAFLMPMPHSRLASAALGAIFALALGGALAWAALPIGANFFCERLAAGAAGAALAGALSTWTSQRMALAALPPEFSFLTVQADPQSLSIAALSAAEACWPGREPRMRPGSGSIKNTIAFARQPGLLLQIEIEAEACAPGDGSEQGDGAPPARAGGVDASALCLVCMIWRPGAAPHGPGGIHPLAMAPAFRAAIAAALPGSRPEAVG